MTKKNNAIGIAQEPLNIVEQVHQKLIICLKFIIVNEKAGHEL